MYRIIKIALKIFPRPLLIKLSLLVHKAVAFFMRGSNVHCPVCGGHFRKFLPYGYVNKRQNALCPGCLSLERHRALWLYLKDNTEFFSKEANVLHIAPEQCFIKRFRKNKNFTYTTGDIESPLADVKMDVCRNPFPDNSFDIVICNHVFEHVDNDYLAMQEFYRVLKPGGMGIFQVPIKIDIDKTDEDSSVVDSKEREKRFGQYDHVRYYGMDYFVRLKNAGFEIDEKAKLFIENMSDKDILHFGIMKDDLLPIVKK